MRITLVISSLQRGGAERVMCLLATSWVEQGHEVTLLTLSRDAVSAYPIDSRVTRRGLGLDATSHNPFQGLFRNLKRVLVLRRAVRDSNPEVVVSFMDKINVLTVLATRGLRVPVVISERSDPSVYDIGAVWKGLRNFTYGFADTLVCQTSGVLAHLRSTIKVNGCVIPNPVVVPQELAQQKGQRSDRANGHVVAAMGRLAREKGFDLLLQAFSQIAERHPDWSLVIIGGGALRDELEAQAKALDLADRVRFSGEVSNPWAEFADADMFVLSSRFEGFPNALCEAMASGLPVVSFDCPSGPSDIIRQGLDGILVPPQDVSGLATAMDRLMEDETERARLASKAPDVLNRFSQAKILSMWQQLFERVLSSPDGAA